MGRLLPLTRTGSEAIVLLERSAAVVGPATAFKPVELCVTRAPTVQSACIHHPGEPPRRHACQAEFEGPFNN